VSDPEYERERPEEKSKQSVLLAGLLSLVTFSISMLQLSAFVEVHAGDNDDERVQWL
jgi:hypothetical protein